MVDRFSDPLFTPKEVATYLQIPRPTVYRWLSEKGDEPLVHHVPPERRGAASVPFVGLVEAYVLNALRNLRFGKPRIRAAVDDVRQEFGTPYALASKRIATDGVEIFARYAEYGASHTMNDALDRELPDHRIGVLAEHAERNHTHRVHRPLPPVAEVVGDYLRYLSWDADGYASQLQLYMFSAGTSVVIDPRFGWGAPTVLENRVPVRAIIDLWTAGESIDAVAEEYDMSAAEVEGLCQAALRAAA